MVHGADAAVDGKSDAAVDGWPGPCHWFDDASHWFDCFHWADL